MLAIFKLDLTSRPKASPVQLLADDKVLSRVFLVNPLNNLVVETNFVRSFPSIPEGVCEVTGRTVRARRRGP